MQNISRFFVDRPIFAGVLSVLFLLAGLIAMWRLPISEYPEVVPPSIVVEAKFPGANPAEIAETVASPLEEQINGVEGMLYINSLATTDGNLSLTVTFEIGTDPDLAQQKVQNRVSQAEPRLPDIVRQLGVTVSKRSPDLTMVVHLLSPNDRYDMLYLRNYATLNVKDRLARIKGVGQVGLFGSGDYAMRVWLNPDRVAELGLTAGDVVSAIQSQNIQVWKPPKNFRKSSSTAIRMALLPALVMLPGSSWRPSNMRCVLCLIINRRWRFQSLRPRARTRLIFQAKSAPPWPS